MPRDNDFLKLFDQASTNILNGMLLFRETVAAGLDGLAGRVDEIKKVEHEGDRITHRTLAKLNTTFITPFDREDIHALISRMDDIIDATDACSQRLLLYKVKSFPPRFLQFADLLVAAARQVQAAVLALHETKRHRDALASCVEINRLENEGDALHRESLAELFANVTDAIEVIKLKELYTFLEEAMDRCEDVANVIESIIIKSS